LALRVVVDRPVCIGAGNCIAIAPTAFDWLKGDYAKAAVVDIDSVDEEVIREAAMACPTLAIKLEEVGEALAWRMPSGAGASSSRRVVKTFMFTDMVASTQMAELLGDDEWGVLLQWHDETLRGLFATHKGHEVMATGDGFFVDFESPDEALGCAVAIQRTLANQRREHGFAPRVRIGIHLADATQVGQNYRGKGVHQASRIAGVAGASEILVSRETVEQTSYRASSPRTVELKGIAEPVEVVSVDWQ
jgi:class 3 adenylate cyclase